MEFREHSSCAEMPAMHDKHLADTSAQQCVGSWLVDVEVVVRCIVVETVVKVHGCDELLLFCLGGAVLLQYSKTDSNSVLLRIPLSSASKNRKDSLAEGFVKLKDGL